MTAESRRPRCSGVWYRATRREVIFARGETRCADVNRLLTGLETLVGRKLATAAKLGALFLPANSIVLSLQRYCQNLVHFIGEPFEVQLIGSTTNLRWRGRNIILSTFHQLRGVEMDNVGVIIPDRSNFISSAGASTYKDEVRAIGDDLSDICAFDFVAPIDANPDLRHNFYDLELGWCVNTDTIDVVICYGCAFADQDYDVLDARHIKLSRRAFVCRPDGQPVDQALSRCKAIDSADTDPDGFSGGPVFAVCREGMSLTVKFAGMILRGGGGYFHYLKAEAVVSFLKTVDKKAA